MKPGKKCSREDDLEFIFHKIAEADGIILSSPVYNWGVNIGIRRIFDRAFLFKQWADVFVSKPCVTFVTYGLPYEEGYALSTLNELVRQLNFRLKDSAAFIGALPGDVLKYVQNIERAKQLGEALFSPSYKREGRGFECPNCFSNMVKFRSETDFLYPGIRPIGQVECAFCGTVAEIKFSEKGVEVRYLGKGLYDKEFPKRLAEWHRVTMDCFIREKRDMKRMLERYKNIDVKVISKYD
jgi:hypothetical protein